MILKWRNVKNVKFICAIVAIQILIYAMFVLLIIIIIMGKSVSKLNVGKWDIIFKIPLFRNIVLSVR